MNLLMSITSPWINSSVCVCFVCVSECVVLRGIFKLGKKSHDVLLTRTRLTWTPIIPENPTGQFPCEWVVMVLRSLDGVRQTVCACLSVCSSSWCCNGEVLSCWYHLKLDIRMSTHTHTHTLSTVRQLRSPTLPPSNLTKAAVCCFLNVVGKVIRHTKRLKLYLFKNVLFFVWNRLSWLTVECDQDTDKFNSLPHLNKAV